MRIIKKIYAKCLLILSNRKFHKSYHEKETDGLTTAEHCVLGDKYIRCMVKFKVPMIGLDEDKRTLWMSENKKAIIAEFSYDNWYNLFLKIGLDIDVANECITIQSPDQEHELKLEANA